MAELRGRVSSFEQRLDTLQQASQATAAKLEGDGRQLAGELRTRFESVESHLSKLTEASEATIEDLANHQSVVRYGAGLASLLLAVLGFFGYSQLRAWMATLTRSAEEFTKKNAADAIQEAVNTTLPQALSSAVAKIEAVVFRDATVLAQLAAGTCDQALTTFGWNHDVAALRAERLVIRRAIIECLHRARAGSGDARQKRRADAWEAVTELLVDDPSIETLRLYLRLAISGRRHRDGNEACERHVTVIRDDPEAALRWATLLRRQGRLQEALELARRFETSSEYSALVTRASLERDYGEYDKAHDLLLPAARAILEAAPDRRADGWHRVMNTFVANCVDREAPEEAVPWIEFALRHRLGAVEVFTAGRALVDLPMDHPKRAALVTEFRDCLLHVTSGEARTRCEVLIRQMEGDRAGAIEYLAGQLAKRDAGYSEHDDYHLRCMLASLLVEAGKANDALNQLVPVISAKIGGGEAMFVSAAAYAAVGKGDEAARWAYEAGLQLPKWIARTRKHPGLRNLSEVQEALRRLSQRDSREWRRSTPPAATS